MFGLTFGCFRHPQGADDLADAVLGANAIRADVSPLDDLCGGDLGVGRFCGNEWG